MRHVLFISALLLFGISALAQTVPCPFGVVGNCERVLLPILVPPTDGALGSRFVTSLSLFNRGTALSTVLGIAPPCPVATCGPPETPLMPRAHATGFVPTGNPGTLIYVVGDATSIAAELRVQDVSRQGQTWGTEIPVVRDSEFFSDLLALLDLPDDDRFRLTLRVYSISRDPATVRVRIRETFTNQVINDFRLDLAPGADILHPAFGSFSHFPADPLNPNFLVSPPRLRVEIEPLTPGLRFWAFVSVTNNETQHITTITPR